MKILVTGGGGFLGQEICRMLLAQGDEPVAFQRGEARALAQAGIEVRRGDIGRLQDVLAAAEGCEAVIHTAGKAGAWGDAQLYRAVNVSGTQNVLQACEALGIQRLVFTSSPSVAHSGGDIEGGDESLPYPRHYAAPYPQTKAAAEQLVMAASGSGLKTVSLRPHLVWGAGDNQLLPRLVERARRGTLRLPGADKLIDATYIYNAARAHLLALAALDNNEACHGKTYFISNGEPWPQAKIIAALLNAVGVNADIKPIAAGAAKLAGILAESWWRLSRRDDEPPVTRWSAEQLATAHWYDISAARKDLGYEPVISMAEGLKRLAQSAENARLADDIQTK
ncbi:NAD-dependent epimerase/dehydratase family protein [Congregibacter sp.]|nr:NAD-dependent epimerase/dehydratase family protein [Congregibacter sp.]MDA8961841.1 NAD-dependent epimerase/dehydratase family protein [Congregibacter sp.]